MKIKCLTLEKKGDVGFCGCVDGPKGDKGKITAYFLINSFLNFNNHYLKYR